MLVGVAADKIKSAVVGKVDHVQNEINRRGHRIANELRNSSQVVLRGQRSGVSYRIPFTKKTYKASAPGEPPAVRTGVFRASWGTKVESNGSSIKASIESNVQAGGYQLGELLEDGTSKMAPRPYADKIIEMTMPKALAIVKEPIFK